MRIISGSLRGRLLKTVEGPGYRPAMGRVREALFSMLASREALGPETRVLDLFAGSGALAFEALSRGAAQADMVELDKKATLCLARNVADLGLAERCRIHEADVRKFLGKPPAHPYDLVFIDPPYGQDLFLPALGALIRKGWLAPQALVMAELEYRLKLNPEALPEHMNDFLEPVTDRLYGQTRIILWQLRHA